MSEVGKRIKELRIKHNMTQAELGALLGVQKSAVQKYESGNTINLRADKIKLLCQIFRVYPRYFIFDTDSEYWETLYDGLPNDLFPVDPIATKLLEEHYGLAIYRLMNNIKTLNTEGVAKVTDYINDLCKIDDYKKGGE